MKTFSQIKEYVEDGGGKNSAANAYKSQTPGQESKVEVKEAKFNSKKELSDVAKLDKLLENAYKGMGKLQHGKSEYLRKLNDGIVEARRALDTYVDAIKSGKLDD